MRQTVLPVLDSTRWGFLVKEKQKEERRSRTMRNHDEASIQSEDPLNEIQGFNREDLQGIKSGFKPIYVRNPHTTIYNVPENIYRLKREPYTFCFQYFGIAYDFEYCFPKQRWHDLHIFCHVHSFLSRNRNNSFEDYIMAMNAMREEIKSCHLVFLNVDFKRLVALVSSCCQILDCMLLFYRGKLTPQVDQVCSSSLQDLWMDMLLVNAQVPFFALQRMYDMLVIDKLRYYPSLIELCLHFFEKFVEFNTETPPMQPGTVHHLLHLVHYHLLPRQNSSKRPQISIKLLLISKLKSLFPSHPSPPPPISTPRPASSQFTVESIPPARRLRDAGIKFRRNRSAGFSNITFCKGVLELPYLHVNYKTESLLRNLIVWEQYHLTAGSYFSNYAIFMDYLINTAEDVEILNRSGIIEQALGSEEQVVSIFNGLSTNVAYIGDENDFLPKVCKEVNKYYKSRFNLWWSKLMVDYFSNPWTIISLIAAFFLLMLTTTQTFYSTYSYYRPP